MYAAIEARANVLCAGIFFAIVFIGKLLGGSLWGLFPLGFCVASGVFLWMKDLVRQGRDTEWSSEQKRGETAVVNLIPESVEWLNTAVGLIWGLINPDMFLVSNAESSYLSVFSFESFETARSKQQRACHSPGSLSWDSPQSSVLGSY